MCVCMFVCLGRGQGGVLACLSNELYISVYYNLLLVVYKHTQQWVGGGGGVREVQRNPS